MITGTWDAATQQRVSTKLRAALDAVRARSAAAPSPSGDHSSLQAQLDRATKELTERKQELAYWHTRVACADSADNQAAHSLLRPSAVWGSLVQWLSMPEARGPPAVRSGLSLLASVMQAQDGATPVVWTQGDCGIAAVARVLAHVLAVCSTLTGPAAQEAAEHLLTFAESLCQWSLAVDAEAAPSYLLAVQRLLEQLGAVLGPELLSTLTVATQWVVARLTADGGESLHALALNAAAVLGAMQTLLEAAARPDLASAAPGALGATGATAAAAPAEGTAWRRDVLRSAFDDSLDLVHSWPAVAYAVWQLTALAGAGPGGSAGTPPPAPGLRVPLLACGVPCDGQILDK